jgi:cytochrome P450
LTRSIVSKALFNNDFEEEANDSHKAVTTLFEIFNLLAFPLSKESEDLPLPQTRSFEEAKAKLDEPIYRLIAERRRTGEDAGDLLSLLILATDTEGDGERMSDEQLRDEAITIIGAGHETVTNALTWTWYLLSQHPEVEQKLWRELDLVLADGRAPATRDLPRLPYTEKVFRESMRLYPPVWALGRLAIRDCEIGGRRIPKGSIVLMSQYVTHRNARYFPEPARFLPERWTEETREALPPFAYFPFGGGARRCIGEEFAWMEGILVLASIARSWRLRLAPNQQVEIQPLLTLRPKREINMIAQQRFPK